MSGSPWWRRPALNGIAVLRAYFLLFTGARHVSTVSLGIGLRERFAVLTLSALILGGGLFPQPGVATRRRAAEQILEDRAARLRAVEKPPRLPLRANLAPRPDDVTGFHPRTPPAVISTGASHHPSAALTGGTQRGHGAGPG